MIMVDVNDPGYGSIVRVSMQSDNFYYNFGLSILIKELNRVIRKSAVFVLSDDTVDDDGSLKNIIFRDSMVTINLQRKNKRWKNDPDSECRAIIHIPFVCRQSKLSDVMVKMEKVLLIASMDYSSFLTPDNYRMMGLKKFKQLSLTECKILLLIGKGYNVGYISRILNRSEKTISNHCRNSIRKLGMLNRVDFYKYACFIAHCGNKERNTLCL
ncbi:helix-turn-helix domain-containing protein [Erwinia psidii]|uniref:LuxR family transcriptional regulator n=1 Tax=Erwinia psidii TaxID=69224 RepID=A0A3N6USK2_9GAMM|nr:helix-turn-helix transcriptional regulator [Erwinia psidii]MCX8958685.1 LuxR family transcriptional regulator [Erwinia psidii]MCX8961186.1 LuxR family transcriptional regulator [Erwinia psidii]RQM38979.1 LuxR family transcriptional regulator [Erwinia psidii]